MKNMYILVPCYNEEAVLPRSVPVLCSCLRKLREAGLAAPESRLLLVDDGSTDATWPMLEKLFAAEPEVCALKLRCNRGHQNAVMAGLVTAAKMADAVISIDADLQDDPAAIPEMVKRFERMKMKKPP